MERDDRLVWIDCEMTGLDPASNVLLEIATVVTDNNLNLIEEGPSLIITQPDQALDSMVDVVREMHTKSGLLEKVAGGVSVQEAQRDTMAFLRTHCQSGMSPLCGNSVWADRMFLSLYMPEIIAYLNYRIIDVTTIKELVARWYPNDPETEFLKKETHRALDDIRESIAELRYYRSRFFI